jgi:hypothetical protein
VGVFRSTNNGASWKAANSGFSFSNVYSLALHGSGLFAGTDIGVFLSTDNGTTWAAANPGLATYAVYSLIVDGTSLCAGTWGGGVFRRPLAEMITGVRISQTDVTGKFNLEQNYPNPFNPSTVIRYEVPARLHVTISVFNTLGQQVATLVDGFEEAGHHEFRFDASGLASGVYFYRLRAGEYLATKRLLLIQ